MLSSLRDTSPVPVRLSAFGRKRPFTNDYLRPKVALMAGYNSLMLRINGDDSGVEK